MAEAAARREVLEETGLVAGPLEHLETIAPEDDRGKANPRYRLHVFFGLHGGGEPVAGDDADHAGWYTLADIAALPMTSSSLRLARRLLGER
jgi:ADP-ribose pyrophosphatase YjhB (NUDIX family)